jgi:uncharacterized Fe-S center protein
MGKKITGVSDVYFSDFSTAGGIGLAGKMERLSFAAGLRDIDFSDKLVALKVHFGEPGNLAFLRHNYAACVAKAVREMKGLPFVTDANTLYKGERADAARHLRAATENGYHEASLGCPVIIADGLRGHDHRVIDVNMKHFKKVYIASAIAEADVIISLNHFKGHVETGFGGAIKNIGMGGGSRDGKHQMHSGATPMIDRGHCTGCGQCVSHCAYDAITLDSSRKAKIDKKTCVGCGQCVAVCNFEAALISWDQGGQALGERISEYAAGALEGKEHFHINVITDVSPLCDCVGYNDIPIVPGIGFLASRDPVAIDAASVDLVTEAPINPSSALRKHIDESGGKGLDKFSLLAPEAHWQESLAYAESIGLGNVKYKLIRKNY